MTRFKPTARQEQADEDLAYRLFHGDATYADAIDEQRQRYGVCSIPDCGLPVVGACDGCARKLCIACLTRHEASGYTSCTPQIVDADPFPAIGEPLRALREGR